MFYFGIICCKHFSHLYSFEEQGRAWRKKKKEKGYEEFWKCVNVEDCQMTFLLNLRNQYTHSLWLSFVHTYTTKFCFKRSPKCGEKKKREIYKERREKGRMMASSWQVIANMNRRISIWQWYWSMRYNFVPQLLFELPQHQVLPKSISLISSILSSLFLIMLWQRWNSITFKINIEIVLKWW